MIKGEYKINDTLKIKHFFDMFCKLKRLYSKSFFFYKLDTRKYNVPVSRKLHKDIISTYLDIYFNEFYAQKYPKYFMLSGFLVKARGRKNIGITIHGDIKQGMGISWIWYNRPSEAYFANVKMTKLKGSTGKVNRLDQNYKNEHDIQLLKGVKNTLEQLRQQYKFFKNDK